MLRPPSGLSLPCRYRECRDGDTVVISLPGSDRQWAIRLIDCWAPEMSEPGGAESKAFAEHVLDNTENLHVWIPAPKHVTNLLKNLTFDRIPGHLFISSETTLSEMMVRAGKARATKKR